MRKEFFLLNSFIAHPGKTQISHPLDAAISYCYTYMLVVFGSV